MGTLFDQSPRKSYYVDMKKVDDFLDDAKKLATKHKITVETVIEAYKIKELERRNELYHDNGDAFDEQLAGFGKILEEMTEAIHNLKETV